MWDAVDLHVDSNNRYDTCTREQADKIIEEGTPFWGIAIADHDKQELLLSKKYYAFGQFTRYIRPGYCLIGSSDQTVAAYDPKENKIVIVALNTNSDDQKWEFDLSDYDVDLSKIQVVSTTSYSSGWDEGTHFGEVMPEKKTFTGYLAGSSITTFIIG